MEKQTDSPEKIRCRCGWYIKGCAYPNGPSVCPRWNREMLDCPVEGGPGKSLTDETFNSSELWRARAEALWQILDNIDTASDMAKGNDKAYRKLVEEMANARFEIGGSDGYNILWRDLKIDENGKLILEEA